MIQIDYPKHQFRIKEEGSKEYIFDEVRKVWIRLTPEEWVRQNLIRYLIDEKKVPTSLIAVEKQLLLNGTKRRTDIVVYNSILCS